MKPLESYTLTAKLGEGGMAEVFKAVKRGPDGFEKAVAIKRILPHLADNESFIRMLSAEARLVAMLDHPNLVHVYDFFAQDNAFYIALEYVSGPNLRRIMHDTVAQKEALPWPAAVHIVTELLKGLDFAHKRKGPDGPLGIVHRDVSPQNILVSYDGLVKLSDFGIARANIAREETASGVVKGKERYLSPEQLHSNRVDFHADIFSAAVVLYELLTNRHPFEAENSFDTMLRISEGQFTPIATERPDLPQDISAAVQRAMHVSPKERPKDAGEFRAMLHRGQENAWLTDGTKELSLWLETLYPKGVTSLEVPIEKTPILDGGGTRLPVNIEPIKSLISKGSGVAPLPRRNARRFFLWSVMASLVLSVFGGLTWVIRRSEQLDREEHLSSYFPVRIKSPPQASPTPLKIVALPSATPTLEEPKEPLETRFVEKKVKRKQPAPAVFVAKGLGELVIDAPPDSSVFVNGRMIGKAPIAPLTLAPGAYNVVIASGHVPKYVARVFIKPAKQTMVRWKAEVHP